MEKILPETMPPLTPKLMKKLLLSFHRAQILQHRKALKNIKLSRWEPHYDMILDILNEDPSIGTDDLPDFFARLQ